MGHFTQNFGFSRGGTDAWHTVVTNPRETICLQAADYFLWALQRFYEPRIHPETGEVTHEARYLNANWPQVSQIHDLHFGPKPPKKSRTYRSLLGSHGAGPSFACSLGSLVGQPFRESGIFDLNPKSEVGGT